MYQLMFYSENVGTYRVAFWTSILLCPCAKINRADFMFWQSMEPVWFLWNVLFNSISKLCPRNDNEYWICEVDKTTCQYWVYTLHVHVVFIVSTCIIITIMWWQVNNVMDWASVMIQYLEIIDCTDLYDWKQLCESNITFYKWYTNIWLLNALTCRNYNKGWMMHHL